MNDKNQIRQYRNTVHISFDKPVNGFTLNVPHYKKWLSIIMFLRNRGFKVTKNKSYEEHYKPISKYHKIGFKKNVACLMEITGRSIIIEYGNIQNLWTGIAQNFWDNPTDERYTKLSYLEDIAVRLEIKKLVDYCKNWGFEFTNQNIELSPEEGIIKSLNNNTHIHGKVTSLNDIKISIDQGLGKHNQGSNSDDKNNKKIVCGDLKYYYDYYTKRLCCGIVWHNINNMWWVLTEGTKKNKASFELFDFHPELPKRKPVDLSKLENIQKSFENKKDYKRCIELQKVINKATLEKFNQKNKTSC